MKLGTAIAKNGQQSVVDKIEMARVARDAFKMRIDGHDWIDICEQLSIADIELFRGTVWHLIKDTVSDEERQALKAIELARLERLHRKYWSTAITGSIDDAEFCLKISKQRVQLMGLNSPTTIDVTATQSFKTYILESPEAFDAISDGNSDSADKAEGP